MRVGLLTNLPRSEPVVNRYWSVFEQELHEHGWVEGRNLTFERRYTNGDRIRVPALLAELAALKVDVIWTGGNMTTPAEKNVAGHTPIVFALDDPVGRGIVASLARPGGTATGISRMSVEVQAKQIELLKQTAPAVSHVALLMDPAVGYPPAWRGQSKPAGIAISNVEVRGASDLTEAFAKIARLRANGIVVVGSSQNYAFREQVVAAVARLRIPAIFSGRELVEAGGLMSYGIDLAVMLRQAAIIVDKILRGARPQDLPVEQPLAFELFVNKRTASAIGIAIPPELLLRADRIVE